MEISLNKELLQMASKLDLLKRVEKLIHWLKDHKLPGCFIQDPTNLLYYTGINISTGILFIGVKKQVLIVDFRYYDRCKKEVPIDVLSTKNFKKTLKTFRMPAKVGVDSHVTLLKDYELYKEYCEPISHAGFLSQLRMVKTSQELKLIKESCEITKAGFKYIQKHFKEGITEIELKTILEVFLLKNGAEKMAFDPIVAFGKNSANPHYSPGNVKLKKDDVILIDCGSVWKNYYSDMTRTYITGEISGKMERLIDLCKEAQKRAVEICRPGLIVKDLNECVQKFFKEEGVQDLFIHGLGHGVGLEVHEYPSLGQKEMVLEKGMVITIEPGLYVAGLGGVRIEDTLMITSNGYQNLTN